MMQQPPAGPAANTAPTDLLGLPHDLQELIIKGYLAPREKAMLSATCRMFRNYSPQIDPVYLEVVRTDPLYAQLKPDHYTDAEFLLILTRLNTTNLPWHSFLVQLNQDLQDPDFTCLVPAQATYADRVTFFQILQGIFARYHELNPAAAALPWNAFLVELNRRCQEDPANTQEIDFAENLLAAAQARDAMTVFVMLFQRNFRYQLTGRRSGGDALSDTVDSPLEVAVAGNDILTAHLLLQAATLGEEVNQIPLTAESFLCTAARNGNVEMCKLLLRFGANLDPYALEVAQTTNARWPGRPACAQLLAQRMGVAVQPQTGQQAAAGADNMDIDPVEIWAYRIC